MTLAFQLQERKAFVGRRFGRLVVLKFHSTDGKNSRWLCRCDCGKRKKVLRNGLVRGTTASCGCLQQEARTSHGMSGSPEYSQWADMVQRCNPDPESQYFENYAGRGIKICKRWRKFVNFFADMGKRPTPKHSLGRIDNDGDYKKSNCRWELPDQQARNKRGNVFLTAFGKTQCLKDWATEIGVAHQTIQHRIGALGWSVEKALSTKRYESGHKDTAVRIEFGGESLTVSQWAVRTGITVSTLWRRIAIGRPPEEILSKKGFRSVKGFGKGRRH